MIIQTRPGITPPSLGLGDASAPPLPLVYGRTAGGDVSVLPSLSAEEAAALNKSSERDFALLMAGVYGLGALVVGGLALLLYKAVSR